MLRTIMLLTKRLTDRRVIPTGLLVSLQVHKKEDPPVDVQVSLTFQESHAAMPMVLCWGITTLITIRGLRHMVVLLNLRVKVRREKAKEKAREKKRARSTTPPARLIGKEITPAKLSTITKLGSEFLTMPTRTSTGTVTTGVLTGGLPIGSHGGMTILGITGTVVTAGVRRLHATLATDGPTTSRTSTTAAVRWRVIPTGLSVERRF